MTELSLEELAIRAQANANGRDRDEYFAELVRRLRGRLGSFLLRRTGRAQDVDDLVQETFLKAYNNLERYQPKWRFSTWIFTIAARLAMSEHRRQTTRQTMAPPSPSLTAEPAASPAMLVAEREESVKLWATAESVLNDDQYAVIWLHYARDMSAKEIAEATGRSAIHVRVLLYRARKKLATEMACSAP